MMDSEGTPVIFNEHSSDWRTSQSLASRMMEEAEGRATSSTSERAPGMVAKETEEKEVTGHGADAGGRTSEETVTENQRIGVRSEALNFVSPVGNGITLGKWTLWREEVWDFLQDELFQPGFFNPALRRKVGIPPKRTAAKDTWLTTEDLPDGGKVSVREHVQERKKMFDFSRTRTFGVRRSGPHGG